MNSLIWSFDKGHILIDDILFNIFIKPNFSFEYTELYYDPDNDNVGLNSAGIFRPLNENEIKEIQEFCDNFIETQDFYVSVIDEDGIFEYSILKSEAIQQNKLYCYLPPPENYEFSKLVKEDKLQYWSRIFAAIDEDGSITFYPDSKYEFILFLTEDEYKKFPKRPNRAYSYDFRLEQWVDKRDINKLKLEKNIGIYNEVEKIEVFSFDKKLTRRLIKKFEHNEIG